MKAGGQHRFGGSQGDGPLTVELERDHFCNMLRQIPRDHPDLRFDHSMVTIGLRRLWDGRRDILQLLPVQLVGMQAAWLNGAQVGGLGFGVWGLGFRFTGAQGMIEGFKDAASGRFTVRIECPDDVVTRTGGTAKVYARIVM